MSAFKELEQRIAQLKEWEANPEKYGSGYGKPLSFMSVCCVNTNMQQD